MLHIDTRVGNIETHMHHIDTRVGNMQLSLTNEVTGVTKMYTDVSEIIDSSLKIVYTYRNVKGNHTIHGTGSLVSFNGGIRVLTAAHCVRDSHTKTFDITQITTLLGNCSVADLQNSTKFASLVSKYIANSLKTLTISSLADTMVKAGLHLAINIEQRTNYTAINSHSLVPQVLAISWYSYRELDFVSPDSTLNITMNQAASFSVFENDTIDLTMIEVTVTRNNSTTPFNPTNLKLPQMSKYPLPNLSRRVRGWVRKSYR